MSPILCIDTALETASVGIADNERLIAIKTNAQQADHAAWIHTAIRDMMQENSVALNSIKAVAVCSGPGSYTGLRVGMATAKGLCYALKVPLLTENTLKLTAHRTALETVGEYPTSVAYCPMIDARRMEVFTCVYDHRLTEMIPPSALILREESFRHELDKNTIVFSGNGAPKWRSICKHGNARFANTTHQLADLAIIASRKYAEQKFSDLAYAEPDYFKNFYTGN